MALPESPAIAQGATPYFYRYYLRRHNYMADIYAALEQAAVKVHIMGQRLGCERREKAGNRKRAQLEA